MSNFRASVTQQMGLYGHALIKEELPRLYQYIWGIIKEKQCHLYRINGVEEHLHLLSDLHPSIALSDFIRDIKTSTSFWIKENGLFPFFNGWGVGYCAVTCGHKDKNSIIECTPKSKNFVKFEANGFFDPELSFDNEDSKKIWVCNRWFYDSKKFYTRLLHTPSNEEVGKIGLFGVGSLLII